MSVSFDFDGRVAIVTGVAGALGSSVARRFGAVGATVVGVDVREPNDEDAQLRPGTVDFREADLTDESTVERLVADVVDDHGRLDYLLNIAGTWRGGTPIDETDLETFEMLFAVNLRTAFLASKHALPHLRETGGAIVNVSAKSSLRGGSGDGPYRAAKAGVRLLTETIADENDGTVRANAVLPDVIDTPTNREAMPDADRDDWVDPSDISVTILALCSEALPVTNGAAIPVYG